MTNRRQQVVDEIADKLTKPTKNLDDLTKRIDYVCKRIEKFWTAAKRSKTVLLSTKSLWLCQKEIIILEKLDMLQRPDAPDDESRGRPKLNFALCSNRSKRRR